MGCGLRSFERRASQGDEIFVEEVRGDVSMDDGTGRIEEDSTGDARVVRFKRMAGTPPSLPPRPKIPKPPKYSKKDKQQPPVKRVFTDEEKRIIEFVDGLTAKGLLFIREYVNSRVTEFLMELNPDAVVRLGAHARGRMGEINVEGDRAAKPRSPLLLLDPELVRENRELYRHLFGNYPEEEETESYQSSKSNESIFSSIVVGIATALASNAISEVINNPDLTKFIRRLLGGQEKGGYGEGKR